MRRCVLQSLYWTFPMEVHVCLQSYVQSEHILSLTSPPTQGCSLSRVQSPQWVAPTGASLARLSEVIPFPAPPPRPCPLCLSHLGLLSVLDYAKCHPTSEPLRLLPSLPRMDLLQIDLWPAPYLSPERGLSWLNRLIGFLSVTLHSIILTTVYINNVLIFSPVHLHPWKRELHANRAIIHAVRYHMHSAYLACSRFLSLVHYFGPRSNTTLSGTPFLTLDLF